MKKRLKVTIEIDTDNKEAEGWSNVNHYIEDQICKVLSDVRWGPRFNYTSYLNDNTLFKVSLREIKKKTI